MYGTRVRASHKVARRVKLFELYRNLTALKHFAVLIVPGAV
jgi:hypothetical protein